MNTEAARAFSARVAYWTGQGLSGVDLYEALATDAELPATFDPVETAEILNISPLSLKKARNRASGLSFLRMSSRAVRYPRAELCRYLGKRFVRIAA